MIQVFDTLERMSLPKCAYCGTEFSEVNRSTRMILYCTFDELPGKPRVAWHWYFDEPGHTCSCYNREIDAKLIKETYGDVAAIINIMSRGKGRVLASRAWGEFIKKQDIKVEHHPAQTGEIIFGEV